VLNHKTGQVERAASYLLDDFKEELLNEKAILFESYSSINDYYPEYKKFEDTDENTNSLLRQLNLRPSEVYRSPTPTNTNVQSGSF
jgi:hypothetical protein